MNCPHPSAHDELPCPWPGCPEGTPQQTVVLVRGEEAAVTSRQHSTLKIEADGGAEMWRRREVAGSWEWVRVDLPRR